MSQTEHVTRASEVPDPAEDGSWTAAIRRRFFGTYPPETLLPARQPAYMSSWIYVFGVLTIAALLMIIVSGLVLSFEGPTWYHTSSIGLYTNSLHFWSVQLFFVFMVVHLWGKFWMAAWRGHRAMTWITGVVAFLASIGTAFTGYLVQTNFDSQWISFEAKDGLNTVGIGAWFNVTNLGQTLLVHVCLLPLVLGVIIVGHILLVRKHGIVPPIDAELPGPVGTSTEAMSTRRYDIVKEGIIAIVVVAVLTVSLAAILSSPDDKALTFKGWAQNNAANFYATTVSELAGTSESAGYGPPYNDGGDGLSVGPINLQKAMGVRIPVDPANDFVITPLKSQEQPSAVAAALATWVAASADEHGAWATAYDTALNDPAGADGDAAKVPPGEYGPVPALANGLLSMAASGAYDGILMGQAGYYQTDYTKSILFFGDGAYLDDAATAANLQGGTWGMMNETGSYPGQAWLWLYSFWYQIPPFTDEASAPFGANADAYIFYIMALLSIGLMLVPFIPGIRSIPKRVPVHRLVWREYYARHGKP